MASCFKCTVHETLGCLSRLSKRSDQFLHIESSCDLTLHARRHLWQLSICVKYCKKCKAVLEGGSSTPMNIYETATF